MFFLCFLRFMDVGSGVLISCFFLKEDLHLSPVSAVVQLHPQLHHLDALDEVPVKGRGSRARKEGDEGQPGESEARAIDVKIKAAEDGEAAMVAGNLELLKKMQDEKWNAYEWVDAEVSHSCYVACPISSNIY